MSIRGCDACIVRNFPGLTCSSDIDQSPSAADIHAGRRARWLGEPRPDPGEYLQRAAAGGVGAVPWRRSTVVVSR